MTSPRERRKYLNTLRTMAISYKYRVQRELDRPKLCDQSLEAQDRYNRLVDRHGALCWALRELDPKDRPQTWPEIRKEIDGEAA